VTNLNCNPYLLSTKILETCGLALLTLAKLETTKQPQSNAEKSLRTPWQPHIGAERKKKKATDIYLKKCTNLF